MSIFEHSRFRVFTQLQHPYRHDASEFAFANPRLPGVTSIYDALNYLTSVMYPDYIGTYANFAALPVAPAANSYAIVSDDGSGFAAGYIYTVIDGVSAWVKRYDMNWSTDSILAETVNRTQTLYPAKYGADDKDASGATITGTYAGQRIYGGLSANNNLTLSANAGNTLGTHSGYIQADDNVRPTVDNAFTLGTAANRWANIYTTAFSIGTMSLAGGSISDSSGAVSFGALNLSTTGTLGAGVATLASGSHIGNLTLSNGSITDSGGTISHGSNNVTTTGTMTAATGSVFGNLTLATGSITSGSGAITFGAANLVTTGTLGAGVTTVTSVAAGNVTVAANTVSTTNLNGDLNLTPNGSGKVSVSSALAVTGNLTLATASITVTAGSITVGNLTVGTGGLTSTGTITLTPGGGGTLTTAAKILPNANGTLDLGSTTARFQGLYLSSLIGDGTNTITTTDLLRMRNVSFRDAARTQAAQAGDALFYDAVSGTWLASVPDTEITHSTLSGLVTGDAGHTQFALLAGRSGGQVVQGGTAASENLTLASTAHATKGSVQTSDNLIPTTTASFSATWSGTDLGDSAHSYRDVYTKGQFKGLRFENFTSGTLPSASASAPGRMLWSTDNSKVYVDTGGSWKIASIGKHQSDVVADGTTTAYTVTISGISDARTAIWQLCDNSNNYERIYTSVQAISATQVTITANPPLPAGSYRLLGVE